MSETYTVTFIDEGDADKKRTGKIEAGGTLLDAAHAAGIDMEATCGARGRCRSCRCKVLSGDVPPATVQDNVQLGVDAVRENFRLACQTKAIGDTTAMALPPKSESGHQILSAGVDVDASGFVLDSGVKKHFVTAKAPEDEHKQTSDIEEVLEVMPEGTSRDVPLEVLRTLPEKLRKQFGELTVTTFENRIIHIEVGDTTEHIYGMAFDIGTTSIVGTLMNLLTGETLADVGGVNPQATYGGDLMSRIAYAQFDDKKLQTLRAKALNAINDFVKNACAEADISSEHVYKIVVVGNTCMHHLLIGIDVTHVGLAPYAPVVRDPLVLPAKDLPLKGAPNSRVCMMPIVAGFVGADTMGCVLATKIYESDEIRVLADIGTNGEVVMGSKAGLMACSAPAGPALEGAQIRHGMRGSMGAIERVAIDQDVECKVIGDAPAIGICGSGIIDACAKMIDAGVMDSTGRLRKTDREELPEAVRDRIEDTADGQQFVLVNEEDSGKGEAVTLTQADIRQLQLAKSAIFSGITMLQKVMEVSDEKLAELMLCGGFGNYINIESSVRVRLLPDLPLEKITYAGNAALLGAQMALLSDAERTRSFEIANSIEHVALATAMDFQEIFVDGMNFSGEPFPRVSRKVEREREAAKRAAAGD